MLTIWILVMTKLVWMNIMPVCQWNWICENLFHNLFPLYFKKLAFFDQFSKIRFLGPHFCWRRSPLVGGGTKYECWNPKWISMSFQYIRSGKKEFLNLVTVLTLHIDPQYLKNHYIRVKSQSCRRPMVWPIKTCARKALSQPKKNRLNRTYQLREKSKKLPENTIF